MSKDGVFDASVAARYDAVHQGTGSDGFEPMLERLLALSGGGAMLEFAVGTGRVALPLVARGAHVAGIELSAAMVDVLRGKEAGDPMEVVVGDMTTARVPGAFALVFLVYNTIDNLTTQEAQLACFENAARHLAPGGRFVIETLVPPLQRLPFGARLLANEVSEAHWGVDEFDVVTQAYWSHHLHEDGTRLSVPFRYAWPAEMDLMARAAGMVLEHRWADWQGAEFTAESGSHVSVWRKGKKIGKSL